MNILDTKKMMQIYAEATPNPLTMKFVADHLLFKGTVDYPSKEQAFGSPLAKRLFEFPFVKGVFISENYVTVTKDNANDWYELVPELREFLISYISANEPVVTENTIDASAVAIAGLSDIEQKIQDILAEYVQPAVQQDGGAIIFRSFEDGVVTVTLQGACSGCPSSTLTLKAGIESLLKRMIPEVTEVISEAG